MKILSQILIYIISVKSDESMIGSDSILVLNDENFNAAIQDNPNLMVNFHAPWCSHCKELDPEYSKAAQLLQDSDVTFAKLDVETEKLTAEKFNIQSLPKLMLFRNGDGIDYSGPRAAQGMVEWIGKKTKKGIITITKPGELQYIVEEEKIFVVGYFSNLESDEYKIFESTYFELDEVKFFLVSETELMKEYHQKDGSIMVMKTFDEKLSYFSENLTIENLKNFILREILPLVVDFSPENADKIFKSKIRNHFLFMSDKSDTKHEETMRNVS